MQNSILRFGIVYGLLLWLGFLASHWWLGTADENFGKGEVVGYSVMLVSSVSVVLGILHQRKSIHPDTLSLKASLWVGSCISAIGGAMFGLYNYAYLTWIHPSFTQDYMAYQEALIRNSGAEQAVIEQQLAELAGYAELMSNHFIQALVMFATVFVIGMLFALAAAATLRNTTY